MTFFWVVTALGFELELRFVRGQGVTPQVPWVPYSGPLCPSFRIGHPLAAKANWWPGLVAPVTAPLAPTQERLFFIPFKL